MLIERKNITKILKTIEELKTRRFNINTQYKMLKIEKAILQEQAIFQEQIETNCKDFFEKDVNGNPLINGSGGYKIQKDKIEDCCNLINRLTALKIQLPDIYFSLDELEELDLTLEELQALENFVKI